MTGEVIKSFLVGLGFDVDDASLGKFNKAVANATLKVTALYGSTKIAATAITYGISKISEGFEQMGYEYRIIAPAINKALVLRRELLKAYAAAGINITKVVQASVKLNYSLAKTKFAFEAIYKSVASRFFGLITEQSDNLRKRLYQNLPKIQAILERVIKFVFKAFEATTILTTRLWGIFERVYEFLVKLDKATDGWSTKILALIAIWKVLNLSFLASPLGLLLTGLLAILALWDDFSVWREGGESLFNWSKFLPVIDAFSKHISVVIRLLNDIGDAVASVITAFYRLFALDGWQGFYKSMIEAGEAMKRVFGDVIDQLKTAFGLTTSFGSWLVSLFGDADSGPGESLGASAAAGLFGNRNVRKNIENSGTQGTPKAQPLGNVLDLSRSQSQTNQNVHQQTNINVQGVADANAVGKAVSSEQGKVNFDLVRNMKGAVR